MIEFSLGSYTGIFENGEFSLLPSDSRSREIVGDIQSHFDQMIQVTPGYFPGGQKIAKDALAEWGATVTQETPPDLPEPPGVA